jgi:hypothetical protein
VLLISSLLALSYLRLEFCFKPQLDSLSLILELFLVEFWHLERLTKGFGISIPMRRGIVAIPVKRLLIFAHIRLFHQTILDVVYVLVFVSRLRFETERTLSAHFRDVCPYLIFLLSSVEL